MTEQRWIPVERGTNTLTGDGASISVFGNRLIVGYENERLGVRLPETLRLCRKVEVDPAAATVVLEGELSMPVGEIGLLTDDRKTYIEIVELIGDSWVEPDWLARDGRYRITVTRVEERK